MRIKLNSNNFMRLCRYSFFAGVIVGLALFAASNGYCGKVDSLTARRVAENAVQRHIGLYGHWNGGLTATVSQSGTVHHQGTAVAYNFSVIPSGHVLVAIDDVFSPVLLYSTRSSFNPQRVDQTESIENWIIPELRHQVDAVDTFRRATPRSTRTASLSADGKRIAAAWTAYTSGSFADVQQHTRAITAVDTSTEEGVLVRMATVGPLLTTTWGQSAPYNLRAPDDGCISGHTLTGCVATAWAQLLRYWSWPIQGTGSHNYNWVSQTLDPLTQNLSADFEVSYQWQLMPDVLSQGSTADQKDAVALLMYHMGMAAEMQYGCDGSGSSAWADEVLDLYFNFKSSMQFYSRAIEGCSGGQWFALIKADLDADPPRPVVFSIFSPGGGHEVIIDGYQTSPTNMVHINYGWSGYEDGYYNITVDFSAGGYVWDANDQYIVTGIEPDNTPPTVEAGSNQSVDEETQVQLSGSAMDPEGVGIDSYLWTQTSGPTVTLSDAASTSTTFTSPNVHAATQLVFRLRADDANRAYATDTCTITVSNTDGSTAPAPPSVSSEGGGGGGGCFISILP